MLAIFEFCVIIIAYDDAMRECKEKIYIMLHRKNLLSAIQKSKIWQHRPYQGKFEPKGNNLPFEHCCVLNICATVRTYNINMIMFK